MSKECTNFSKCGNMAYQAKNGIWYCNNCHPDSAKVKNISNKRYTAKEDKKQ